ncbi:hypothetical protein [Brevundimonas sp.]|uniref:hypothetical protein n=1 Tax=Brevundimonas sp. TaxID=1871086 RepID=UPI002D3FDE3E|nr:hypothetical protein [Brevundimonas sp.]HYC97965.1 hypothetical protein [Brevundimonas sp.]
MKRFVSTGFMAIYWIALPVTALAMVGLGYAVLVPGAVFTPGARPGFWMSFLLSTVLTLLIVWRLWTHDRARRCANEHASSIEDSRSDND